MLCIQTSFFLIKNNGFSFFQANDAAPGGRSKALVAGVPFAYYLQIVDGPPNDPLTNTVGYQVRARVKRSNRVGSCVACTLWMSEVGWGWASSVPALLFGPFLCLFPHSV